MNLEDLIVRVQTEGKDTLGQHKNEIEEFIRDICREISGTYKFPWLIQIHPVTSAAEDSWVDLNKRVRGILGLNIPATKKKLYPITEEMLFFKWGEVKQGQKGYYRIRYNETKKLFQISFLNLPVNTSCNALVRLLTDDPAQIPGELEEAVVEGAKYKYMVFREGDDFSVGLEHKRRYTSLVQQCYYLLSNEDTYDDEDDRVMTNKELEDADTWTYYTPEDED